MESGLPSPLKKKSVTLDEIVCLALLYTTMESKRGLKAEKETGFRKERPGLSPLIAEHDPSKFVKIIRNQCVEGWGGVTLLKTRFPYKDS